MSYIVVGSKQCAYCKSAVTLLENKALNYKYVDMQELTHDEYNELLEVAKVPFRTVPQIFTKDVDGVMSYVGGFTDLEKSL
jgi:glutaredoxin